MNGCITVSATVLVLEESVQFTRDTEGSAAGEESLRYAWELIVILVMTLFTDMPMASVSSIVMLKVFNGCLT